jgi:hypothetical protein
MSSFKVDPDFLNKINQNIMINEQINAQKQNPIKVEPEPKN